MKTVSDAATNRLTRRHEVSRTWHLVRFRTRSGRPKRTNGGLSDGSLARSVRASAIGPPLGPSRLVRRWRIASQGFVLLFEVGTWPPHDGFRTGVQSSARFADDGRQGLRPLRTHLTRRPREDTFLPKQNSLTSYPRRRQFMQLKGRPRSCTRPRAAAMKPRLDAGTSNGALIADLPAVSLYR